MDEKRASRLDGHSREASAHSSSRKNLFSALGKIFLLAGGLLGSIRLLRRAPSPSERAAISDDPFSWSKVLPSEELKWVKCFENLQCARFEVPLDYAHPHGPKAAVALVKYPSKYPQNHPEYRGPVLYNPGGPGASGVEFIRLLGAIFSTVLGDEYDHIGFDPRGVGVTTPSFNIFHGRGERKLMERLPPPINSTQDALARWYALAQIMGSLAETRDPVTAQHMSTSIVARDMLEITKAHGRDKLLYWGFSYGTILGITYAAMFPDNVGRVIVDGVADTENYYQGAWSNNLIDTDKGLHIAASACANSTSCALHEPTAELVKARIDAILTSVKSTPIPVINGSNYGVADYDLARGSLFRTLYSPFGTVDRLFEALAALENGDGVPLFAFANKKDSLWRCDCGGAEDGESVMLQTEALAAIACGDGDPAHVGLEELAEEYHKMAELSSFADVWPFRILCTGWKLRPVERFAGPFVGNTSFPLLFIGNEADPVTPIWAAHKMSKGFKDAVVLKQNSPGHCSIAAASLCTAKQIRAYFRDGKPPAPGTVCDVESRAFPDPDETASLLNAMSVEDRRLYDAMESLSKNFKAPMLNFV